MRGGGGFMGRGATELLRWYGSLGHEETTTLTKFLDLVWGA